MAKYYKAGDFQPAAGALRWLIPVLVGIAKRCLRRKSTPVVVRQAAERLLASPLSVQGRRRRPRFHRKWTQRAARAAPSASPARQLHGV